MGKINSFYVSGTKDIRPELFDTTAKSIADSFAEVQTYTKRDGRQGENRKGVTSTQLRRIFDEVKRYERIIKDDSPESWNQNYPYIRMIISKVRYTVARAKKKDSDNAIYYENLSYFINEGISLVTNVKEFHIFVALFESVYGFYYEKRPDLKN